MRAVQADELGQGRAHVFHGVVAPRLLQAVLRPGGGGQRGRAGGIEIGGFLAAGEAQALVLGEVPVVFAVVAFQPRLPVHGLLGADEAEAARAERDAVVRVPAAQHGPGHFAGNGAQRGALPGPARRGIAHPDLARGFLYVFHAHAADGVRQIVVTGGRHGWRQARDAQLFEPGQEALEVLAAEDMKDQFGRLAAAAPCDHSHHQAGEVGVVPLRDGGPAGRVAARGGRGREGLHRCVPCHCRWAAPAGASICISAAG
ncbi:hypothetical protein FQZ97_829370 [compost metagenome]